MNQIVLGKFVALKFAYEFDESNFPTRINDYQLIHDRHGTAVLRQPQPKKNELELPL